MEAFCIRVINMWEKLGWQSHSQIALKKESHIEVNQKKRGQPDKRVGHLLNEA